MIALRHRCVAVCCGVLRCVAVCCGALQCVAVCTIRARKIRSRPSRRRCVAVCCSVKRRDTIASSACQLSFGNKVYMCIYVYTYIYKCIYVYVHAHMYMHICICTYVCIQCVPAELWQQITPQCNKLQHNATHCDTMQQHTATLCALRLHPSRPS